MTSLKQLDEILKFLATHPQAQRGSGISEDKIDIYFNGLENMTPNERVDAKRKIRIGRLRRILAKLFKDKFISEKSNKDGINEYRITFDGEVLLEERGYVRRESRLRQKEIRIQKMEVFQKESANNLFYATTILAGGTVGLLLWEVLKYLFEHSFFSCHCH